MRCRLGAATSEWGIMPGFCDYGNGSFGSLTARIVLAVCETMKFWGNILCCQVWHGNCVIYKIQ